MAISINEWNEAKFLFGIGKSLSYISEQTGITKGAISKKANKEKWKKETEETAIKSMIKDFNKEMETLETKKETIVSALASLEDYKLKLMEKAVYEEDHIKSLIFSNFSLALIRSNQQLNKNTKQEVVKFKDSFDIATIELNSQDLKGHVDLNYKIGQAANIIDTKSEIEINNQNNQVAIPQINIIRDN